MAATNILLMTASRASHRLTSSAVQLLWRPADVEPLAASEVRDGEREGTAQPALFGSSHHALTAERRTVTADSLSNTVGRR
jgi:hypothetical protein